MPEPIPNFVWKGEGMDEEAQAAGFIIWQQDGVPVTRDGQGAAVSAWIAAYSPLPRAKRKKIKRLDTAADQRISLLAFIRAGTATNVTSAQFGSYVVGVLNNYRSIRASIQNATSVAEVEAVSLSTGWPANP